MNTIATESLQQIMTWFAPRLYIIEYISNLIS